MLQWIGGNFTTNKASLEGALRVDTNMDVNYVQLSSGCFAQGVCGSLAVLGSYSSLDTQLFYSTTMQVNSSK